MLKKNAKKLMKALYTVFIAIRSNPENPAHTQIIATLRNHLAQDPKQRYSLKSLIRRLEALGKESCVQQLVRILKRPELLSGSFHLNRIDASIPVIIDIFDHLSAKIDNKEFDKARVMASAVHNYPDFIIHEFKAEDFWGEHICYYSRTIGEQFLEQWKPLFVDYYPHP